MSQLLVACSDATHSPDAARRLAEHLQGALLCPERLTLTNIICTNGRQFSDWSADYRLYSMGRVESDLLFKSVRTSLESQLPPEVPLVVAVDDTLVRKTGTKIAGVGWKRDPLGPAFQTNFVRGQRYVQLKDDGYQMIQWSVYARSCVTFSRQETHIARVRGHLPDEGVTAA